MCAIFGSANQDTFKKLYELNLHRGNFASGVVYINPFGETSVHKAQGVNGLHFAQYARTKFYAGHLQAPTSSQREWSYETAHPFCQGNWLVQHNGIITNFNDLKRKYVAYTHDNPVDSSIIPALLRLFEYYDGKPQNQSDVIAYVTSLLQGTYACCIINKLTSQVYLTRCSSTLFLGLGDYSSTEFEHSVPLVEGVVSEIKQNYTNHTIQTTFKFESPFFEV